MFHPLQFFVKDFFLIALNGVNQLFAFAGDILQQGTDTALALQIHVFIDDLQAFSCFTQSKPLSLAFAITWLSILTIGNFVVFV